MTQSIIISKHPIHKESGKILLSYEFKDFYITLDQGRYDTDMFAGIDLSEFEDDLKSMYEKSIRTFIKNNL